MSEDRIVPSKDFSNAPLCLSGRHVTKVFGFGDKKTIAVNDVSFDFHEGEFVSIVGESGSGKTTLSKILLGLLNHTEGEILPLACKSLNLNLIFLFHDRIIKRNLGQRIIFGK